MSGINIDFETRSECDLLTEGAYRYATHPSTGVYMLWYAFPGEEPRLWQPHMGVPQRLAEAVQAGQILDAFNAQFERLIWWYILSPDHGFPEPDLTQFHCTAVQARAHGMPGALGDCARALGLPGAFLKQDHGTRLIQQYSSWNVPWGDIPPEDRELFLSYGRQDVIVERAIGQCFRELDDYEWAEYHACERVNDRGIPVDLDLARAALDYAEDVRADVDRKIVELTGGKVKTARQRKTRDEWLLPQLTEDAESCLVVHKKGERKLSFAEQQREALAVHPDTPAPVQRYLELVNEAGGATISKYQGILDRELDGRVSGALLFNGAGQTGRYSSRGFQSHNMRRDSFDDPEPIIADLLDGYELPDVTDTLAKLIRSAVYAPETGLSWCDWSAIEGRVAPWLANTDSAEKKLDRFRYHDANPDTPDVYMQTAGLDVYGKDPAAVIKAERQIGKVCLLEGTPVLTDTGYVAIENVTCAMRVWDGVEWVRHDGPVYNGEREVVTYDGVTATPDHVVWTRSGRAVYIGHAAREQAPLVRTASSGRPVRLVDAVEHGTGPNPRRFARASALRLWRRGVGCVGYAVSRYKPWLQGLLTQTERRGAGLAGQAVSGAARSLYTRQQPEARRVWGRRYRVWLPVCEGSGAVGGSQSGAAAGYGSRPNQSARPLRAGQPAVAGPDTEPQKNAPSLFSAVVAGFSGALSACTVRRQHPAGLAPPADTGGDSEAVGAAVVQTKGRVWDLLNAGPRHRFTANDRLVANCELSLQFLGGVGALRVMARAYGIHLTEAEALTLRDAWRKANPWAQRFGRQLEAAAAKALRRPGQWFDAGRLAFAYDGEAWLWMKLPSGRLLAYFQPRFEDVETPWGETVEGITCVWGAAKPKVGEEWPRRNLYSGLYIENATQGAAADLLRDALMLCEDEGVPVVLHVHDEIVAQGRCLDQLRGIMLDLPPWADGLPLAAEGGEGERYGK